ncbi:MAG: hypothetical protein D4R88_07735 [Methanosarcinales archaeon]|nr:MAG: hypothetical protein D4R88_07735 [Methanosarcinales archaeon]
MIGFAEIIVIFLFLAFGLMMVSTIGFWLWMLIDCLKRQDGEFATGGNNAKLIWVLVLIFAGLIGAAIYYFLIKRVDSNHDRLIVIALIASVVIVILFFLSFFVVNTETTYSIETYPSSKLPQSTSTVTMNGTIENITIPCPFNIQCNPVYWLAGEDGNTYHLLISSGTRLPDGGQPICEGLLALQEPCLTRLPNRGQHIEVIGIVTYDTISKCELNGQEVPCQPIGRVNVSSWQPR